ncbi:MAG: sugar phosphate isomerase/epimerase family protein, partial [Kiloniellaceae bacterium]
HISLNDANYRWLGGISPDRLRAVGDAIRANDLFVEIDTSGTDPDHLIKLLDAARALGADRLRTYVTVRGSPEEKASTTVSGLRAAAPAAADLGIAILLENHEDFTGREVRRILEQVDHPSVGAVYDFGNSMMVLEDPMAAAQAMAPFVRSVHVKDQIVAVGRDRAEGADATDAFVCGVPIGRGNIEIEPILGYLLETTNLERVCVQSVYGYRAPFTRNCRRLADAEARFPAFAQTALSPDESICLGETEALARIDPGRLLNYELSAVALGVGKVREILANLGFRPGSSGQRGKYEQDTR